MSRPRHRLGLAVEVNEPARAALAQALQPLQASYPGVRWIEPDQWYVELCQLGALDEAETAGVDELAAEVAADSAQLRLRLDGGAGVVGGRALFAGVQPNDEFGALCAQLCRRVEKAGYTPALADDTPCAIVGRMPGGSGLPARLVRTFRGPTVTWTARRLLVVRTRLRLEGIALQLRSAHPFAQPQAALG